MRHPVLNRGSEFQKVIRLECAAGHVAAEFSAGEGSAAEGLRGVRELLAENRLQPRCLVCGKTTLHLSVTIRVRPEGHPALITLEDARRTIPRLQRRDGSFGDRAPIRESG